MPDTRQFSKPAVTTIEEAEFWLGVHHRYAVQDAQHIAYLEARLRVLETPWWDFALRRQRRRFAEALKHWDQVPS